MAEDIRYQRKCFYASAAYSESFWGKFIYIYQGEGSLRLTADSLLLQGRRQAVEIPFRAVRSIGLSRFSSWAKPLGLTRLDVSYVRDGLLTKLHLVPYESVWDSTQATSELVASWHETLGGIEELANRVEPPAFDPAAPSSTEKRNIVARFPFFLFSLAAIIMLLIGWLFARP
mgnify:CR=1 FL=1